MQFMFCQLRFLKSKTKESNLNTYCEVNTDGRISLKYYILVRALHLGMRVAHAVSVYRIILVLALKERGSLSYCNNTIEVFNQIVSSDMATYSS